MVFVMSNEKLCAWLWRNVVFKEVIVSYFRVQPSICEGTEWFLVYSTIPWICSGIVMSSDEVGLTLKGMMEAFLETLQQLL